MPPSWFRRRRALVALVLALACCPAAALAGGPLERGNRGPRVAFIQRTLGLRVDRLFGPRTERAVKRFQRRHGLTADGVVGPATWTALRRAAQRARARRSAASSPRVRTRGAAVRVLQRRLGIAADGVFGPVTRRAVVRFQRSRGLTADGIVGPVTWQALGHPNMTVVLRKARTRHSALPLRVRRVIAAANRIARKPYRYGGGHGRWNDTGYDCSGSVSYALHGGGLLSTPLDSRSLMSYGASGPGRWITVYAHPSHTYMVINGRRYDTTGRAENGTRWQPSMRSAANYTVRHPPGL